MSIGCTVFGHKKIWQTGRKKPVSSNFLYPKYMYKIKLLGLAVLATFLLGMPFSTRACAVRPYAPSYINRIYAVFGGIKPKLVIEAGSNNNEVAFYDGTSIHIYKGDYKGKCSDETPYLKSIISHEYAHHVSDKLKKNTNLKGERLAYLAEHAIGDGIFGDNVVEYDNDADLTHPKAYDAIKNLILSKQNKIVLAKSNSHAIYFKNRK
jgi:hypothetical protein